MKGHHIHLGDPEKDPDYQYHIDVGLYQLKNNQSSIFIQICIEAIIFT
ncbi:DELTA8-fatty-acid desaturase [Bacillus smithii]|nr:DELTA8-fatty-acid desaturase [Bacillus smithii]